LTIGNLALALGNLASADRPGIEQWINLEAIQLLVHHASAVVAAIVIFALVARLAILLLPHGMVRKIVVVIDDVVLIGLLVYFGYEMLVYLWNGRPIVERKTSAGAAIGATLQTYLPPSIAKPLGAIVQGLLG
jgi:hypothetical protein